MRFVPNNNNINKTKAQFNRAIVLGGLELGNKLKTAYREAKVYDTGALIRSIDVTKLDDGARVKVGKEYARYIEYGRRPGKAPPIDALIPWVGRKLSLGGFTKGNQTVELRSKAFLIARSIGRKGIKPKPIFKTTVDNNEKYIFNFIQKKLDEAI